MMAKKASLGRGLNALMAEMGSVTPDSTPKTGASLLPVAMITPSSIQPRRHFNETDLAELAESIKARGVLQPILVRPLADGMHEIIAGERRWRASQMAGLHEMPVVIRIMDESDSFHAALIENIQRVDLNPLEEAQGYQKLIRDYGYAQESVAALTGKSRSHVGNMLRMLDLPSAAQQLVQMGLLSTGHAKAVLAAANPEALAKEITERGLTVRQAEQEAKKSHDRPRERAPRATSSRDPNLDGLEISVSDVLGMKVTIDMDGNAGVVSVRFSSLDQLEAVLEKLQGDVR